VPADRSRFYAVSYPLLPSILYTIWPAIQYEIKRFPTPTKLATDRIHRVIEYIGLEDGFYIAEYIFILLYIINYYGHAKAQMKLLFCSDSRLTKSKSYGRQNPKNDQIWLVLDGWFGRSREGWAHNNIASYAGIDHNSG
jgi:hypothetical protein